MAESLNASGQVVGQSSTRQPSIPGDFGVPTQPFIYQNGRMQPLVLNLPGGRQGFLLAPSTTVAKSSWASTAADNSRRGAIINPGGPPTVLVDPVRDVFPADINNRGQVYGHWTAPADAATAQFLLRQRAND